MVNDHGQVVHGPFHMIAGKSVLVAGSTQGLGLAAAERFAEAGCHVVLNGIADVAHVEAIRQRLEDRYQVRTLFSGANLARPAEVEAMMAAAAQAFGSVDILVNNAVVRHAAPIQELSPAEWDEALAVNLSAAFHTIRLALPMMQE